MKLYTIDRSKILRENTVITLYKDCHYQGNEAFVKKLNSVVDSMYPQGLCEHGNRYIFNSPKSVDEYPSFIIECMFELVRQEKYASCISRFQSIFAFQYEDLGRMTSALRASSYNLFEVSFDNYEKHDMNLTLGDAFATCYYFANEYWSGRESENPLHEYLLLPPVKVNKLILSR